MTEYEHPGAEDTICDFCLSTQPIWDFPCDDFKSVILGLTEDGRPGGLVEWGSVNGWLACVECGRIVLLNDPRALARHATEAHIRAGRLKKKYRDLMVDALEGLYKGFMQARKGPAVPWKPK